MHRLIVAPALLFLLFGAVQGSHDHLARSHFKNSPHLHRDERVAKRQTNNCTSLDIPESCLEILRTINDRNENLASALDEFCIPECVQPYVDYYTCKGYPDQVAYYNNLLCGQNGNEYCLVILYGDNTIEDDIACVPIRGTCTESCASMQETVVDEWGCCAASYYAFYGATCDVGAGDVCDGVVGGGGNDAGIINRVGLGLITMFAMVAALANVVLF